MGLINRVLINKRRKIIAILIYGFIVDLVISIFFANRLYDSNDDIGMKLWTVLFLIVIIPGGIFMLVLLGLIFAVIIKKIISFIKWVKK